MSDTLEGRERAARLIDKLIDGAAHWQAKWRRDGSKLCTALLAADLEILALREQLRVNGIEPIDGERTRRAESTPFITEDRDGLSSTHWCGPIGATP